MKIAGMNITFKHYPIQYFLDCMDQLGISSIELWAGEPHLYVYRNLLCNLREIKKEIKARSMEIVCYTPEQCIYPYNLAASDSNWRKTSIDYFIENIHSAVELETDKILITSGIGDFSLTKEELWKYASESIYQITKVAEHEGITLALEPLTRFESNLIINTRELKRMIDTVAMNLAGETPDDYFLLLTELCHFHLIDGDSKSDSHLALDDGNLQWREYVKSVQKHQYDGACTLEIMGSTYYQNPLDAVKKSLVKLNKLGIV